MDDFSKLDKKLISILTISFDSNNKHYPLNAINELLKTNNL